MGRHYSPDEIVTFKEIILDEISKGKSVLAILRKHKQLPSRRFIYEWLNPANKNYDKEFSNNYAQAKEDSADIDADKIGDIAIKVLKGVYDPHRARVASDNLKWLAGKKKPKKYGNKLDITSANEQLTNQVTVFQLPLNGRETEENER